MYIKFKVYIILKIRINMNVIVMRYLLKFYDNGVYIYFSFWDDINFKFDIYVIFIL